MSTGPSLIRILAVDDHPMLREGIAALLGMLNSCAPNVAVVNIDNGFGAACFAHAILGNPTS